MRNNCLPASQSKEKCKKYFDSLLHRDTKKYSNSTSQPTTDSDVHAETSSPDQASDMTLPQHQDQETAALLTNAVENVVLPTTLVAVCVCGEYLNQHALIDQGSQKVRTHLVFATEPLQALVPVTGEKTVIEISKAYSLEVGAPKYHHRTMRIKILPKRANLLPSQPISFVKYSFSKKVDFAIPSFIKPGQIDMLLGGDVIPQYMLDGVSTALFGRIYADNIGLARPKKPPDKYVASNFLRWEGRK